MKRGGLRRTLSNCRTSSKADELRNEVYCRRVPAIRRTGKLRQLAPVAPVFLSYVLSFVFIGIYWSNHHHLLQVVEHVNGRVLWANLHLLFWLSLVPFVTEWMRHHVAAPLPTDLREAGESEPILGSSPLMRAAMERLARVAAADIPVLIRGESGTGKELAARRIHRASGRSAAPCGAEVPVRDQTQDLEHHGRPDERGVAGLVVGWSDLDHVAADEIETA